MEREEQQRWVKGWSNNFFKEVLLAILVINSILFVIFFWVYVLSGGPNTTEWVLGPLTGVVAIASSLITLVVARMSAKGSVAELVNDITIRPRGIVKSQVSLERPEQETSRRRRLSSR